MAFILQNQQMICSMTEVGSIWMVTTPSWSNLPPPPIKGREEKKSAVARQAIREFIMRTSGSYSPADRSSLRVNLFKKFPSKRN